LTPAPYGRGFRRAEPLALTVLQAGRGVQVRAHEVVLELGRLVKRVNENFALREGGGQGNVVHRTSVAYVAQIRAPRHTLQIAALQVAACSRVVRKMMPGQRSSVSCRFTREGARYTSAPL